MNEDRIAVGLFGTILSATGASLSVNEVQAIISIIVTILGIIISVIVPLIFKLAKKIRDAKKDGKVTIEEMKSMDYSLLLAMKRVKEESMQKERERLEREKIR